MVVFLLNIELGIRPVTDSLWFIYLVTIGTTKTLMFGLEGSCVSKILI